MVEFSVSICLNEINLIKYKMLKSGRNLEHYKKLPILKKILSNYLYIKITLCKI